MSWQIAAAAGAVLGSLSMLLQRRIAKLEVMRAEAFAFYFLLSTGIGCVVAAAISPTSMDYLTKDWQPALVAVCCYALGTLIFASAIARSSAAFGAAIWSLANAWTTIYGITSKGEPVDTRSAFAICLVLGGALLISTNRATQISSRVLIQGLAASLALFMYQINWISVSENASVANWNAVCFLAAAFLIGAAYRFKKLSASRFSKGTLLRFAMLGVLNTGAAILILSAYDMGKLSVVAPLSQSSVVITAALAAAFLKERDRFASVLVSSLACWLGASLLLAT